MTDSRRRAVHRRPALDRRGRDCRGRALSAAAADEVRPARPAAAFSRLKNKRVAALSTALIFGGRRRAPRSGSIARPGEPPARPRRPSKHIRGYRSLDFRRSRPYPGQLMDVQTQRICFPIEIGTRLDQSASARCFHRRGLLTRNEFYPCHSGSRSCRAGACASMLVFGRVDLLGEVEREARQTLAKLLRVELRHLAR